MTTQTLRADQVPDPYWIKCEIAEFPHQGRDQNLYLTVDIQEKTVEVILCEYDDDENDIETVVNLKDCIEEIQQLYYPVGSDLVAIDLSEYKNASK